MKTQRDTVTELLVRDLLLYGTAISPEDILRVLHQVEEVMMGKVWVRFDAGGYLIFYEGDPQSSNTKAKKDSYDSVKELFEDNYHENPTYETSVNDGTKVKQDE